MKVRLPLYKTKSLGRKTCVCNLSGNPAISAAVDNSNLQGKSKNVHELKEL